MPREIVGHLFYREYLVVPFVQHYHHFGGKAGALGLGGGGTYDGGFYGGYLVLLGEDHPHEVFFELSVGEHLMVGEHFFKVEVKFNFHEVIGVDCGVAVVGVFAEGVEVCLGHFEHDCGFVFFEDPLEFSWGLRGEGYLLLRRFEDLIGASLWGLSGLGLSRKGGLLVLVLYPLSLCINFYHFIFGLL